MYVIFKHKIVLSSVDIWKEDWIKMLPLNTQNTEFEQISDIQTSSDSLGHQKRCLL